MIDIRLPNINAQTEAGQIAQMRSYLYQFAEQLKWALNTVESGQTSEAVVVKGLNGTEATITKEIDAVTAFSEIKPLIIKSADIVNAYYEEIDKLLELSGKYVAESEFGTYVEETNQSLSATSDSITQHLSRIETIESDVEGISSSIKKQSAYIEVGAVGTTLDDTGLADETAPGFEIGDYQVLDDGETVVTNKRFARFTAYGLELFGSSLDYPVAYVKQYKLYITDAEITGNLKTGGYLWDTSNGLALKWEGRR